MTWKIPKTKFFDSLKSGEGKTLVDSIIDAGIDIKNRKIRGKTLLSYAAEYGDLELIKYLVHKGADSNITNRDGTKPLHIAAKHSQREAVEFFINLGVCVNSRDYINRTPLHYAVEALHKQTVVKPYQWNVNAPFLADYIDRPIACRGSEIHRELVNFLLRNGADFDAVDSKGDIPILLAARYSCVHVVKTLVSFGANVKCCDGKKYTMLHYASFNGWLDVVSLLLEKGCNINAETKSRDTSLTFAVCYSWKKIVEILIKAGAKSGIYGVHKMSLLSKACEKGWFNVVQYLVDCGINVNVKTLTGETPLSLAIQGSHHAIFDLLVESGANLKNTDCKKTTLLHYACMTGWLDAVQFLVEEGFDIDAEAYNGDTPLQIAAIFFHRDIFYMLLNSGARLDASKPNTSTLLHNTCRVGWLDIVQLLVEAGFDMNAKNENGETPLVIAAHYNNSDILDYLLEAGADVNVKIPISSCSNRMWDENTYESDDVPALTVLHVACCNRWLEAVESLVRKKVDLNIKTLQGETALYLAVDEGNFEIVKCLMEAGADCNIENEDYKNIMNLSYLICKGLGNADTIRLFLDYGACIYKHHYNNLIKFPVYKDSLLLDSKLCTQAIVNRFNRDLKRVYEECPLVVKSLPLPPIEKMKILDYRNRAQCIEESVKHEIETNGFCNIMKIRPIVLSLLSLQSFMKLHI